MPCICGLDRSCPYHLVLELFNMKLPEHGLPTVGDRWRGGHRGITHPVPFLMSTKAGRPVSKRVFIETYKRIAQVMLWPEHRRYTPHSGRVGGAMHWTRLGVGEGSTAALGDWKSLPVLRRYVGTEALVRTLKRDITLAGGHAAAAVPQAQPTELPRRIEAALAHWADCGGETFAIVHKRSRKWHYCYS